MSDPYDEIVSRSAVPVRRQAHVIHRRDPKTGASVNVPLTDEQVTLNTHGNLDTLHVKYSAVLDCGCSADAQFGGECQTCRGLSCRDHHGSCTNCGKPIDPRCSFYASVRGRRVRLCRPCHRRVTRRRFWMRVLLIFLWPFLRIEDQDRNDGLPESS